MKIAVIGGGNMGLTYAESIYKNFDNTRISIVEKNVAKIEQLKKETHFDIFSNASECIENAEIILLAVKPQFVATVFEEINSLVNPSQIIVSIMAGVTIDTIRKGLNTPKIVRAMPNLPSQVGHGVTGFIASAEVTKEETEQIHSILKATGAAVKVANEEAIDAITALSGSGPAYVFYFMNAMMEKAKDLGFSEIEAKDIVLNTFTGTAQLFKSSNTTAETWIERVTSKGGTTHAALTSFKENSIDTNIQKGVQAAFNRAKELGKS